MPDPLQITYIGGPTALIEVGGLRLLTDPVFDPPGGKYSFGLGTGSEKLDAPAIAPDALGRIDAVLLRLDAEPGALAELDGAVAALAEDLLSHFTYEETELAEPLGLLGAPF